MGYLKHVVKYKGYNLAKSLSKYLCNCLTFWAGPFFMMQWLVVNWDLAMCKSFQTIKMLSEACNWSGEEGFVLARILDLLLADWSLNMDIETYQSVAGAMVTIYRHFLVRST